MGISEPLRVTNDINISVRKQIRIAQLKKGTVNMPVRSNEVYLPMGEIWVKHSCLSMDITLFTSGLH